MDDLLCLPLYNRYKVPVFLMGILLAFGEEINNYIPYMSQAYVIIGGCLVIAVFISEFVFRARNVLKYYSGINVSWLLLMAYLLPLIAARFMLGEKAEEGQRTLDFFRIIIFMMIGYALFAILKEDVRLQSVLVKGFVLGFFLAIPIGSFKNYDGAMRFLGTYQNPNIFAIDCCVVIFCLFFLISSKRFTKLYTVLLFVACFVLILTGTRGALLGVLIPVFLYFWKNVRVEYKFLLPILAVLLGAIVLIYVKVQDSSLLDRFISGGQKGTSGAADLRLTIWGKYLLNIKRYFWFGMPSSEFDLVYKKSPHNTYLGMFVRYGIFAFILYMRIVIPMLIRAVKYIFDEDETGYSKALACMFLAVNIAGFFTENELYRTTYAIWALFLAKDYYNDKFVIGLEKE
ncbi:MAG: O-antigen ligase family protein [Lachnospiraceae bacterium]|nr:O-antigen ligase family protein [Lachnospiraceae bacterium]